MLRNKRALVVLVFTVFFLLGNGLNVFAFSDIKGHWAEEIIKWAKKNGIAEGYPDGTFKPNQTVTESEFLTLLIRAYDPTDMITIEQKVHWADDYYAFAMKYNYPTEGLLSLSKRNLPISRTAVAEIIAGTQGVNYSGRDAIHFLLGKGLAKGKSDVISIDGYDGEATLTRSEAVTFIKNVLEKGFKDKDGNPIILPRPKQPTPKDELPELPEQPKKPKQPEPQQPSVPIGSMTGKELFDKTKNYASNLGYTVSQYVNTTGRYSEGEGITAGVFFTDMPKEKAITFSVRDWNNSDDVKLFKELLNNYGVNSATAVEYINNLPVDSGSYYQSQGVKYSYSKRNNNGNHKVAFTIRY